MNKTMKQLPEEERPYEKCLQSGAGILTDAELLGVILRSGTPGQTSVELASDVLQKCRYDDGLNGMLHLSLSQLREIPGVGKVKAVQILCVCELSRRIARSSARKKMDFLSPSSVAEYYMESLRHEEQEVVICMMLDNGNHMIGEREMTRGTISQSLISPREIFLTALEFHATQIILIHNHPSGNPEPSPEDVETTKRVRAAGALIGICLTDHIIIGDRSYTSFLNLGLLQ